MYNQTNYYYWDDAIETYNGSSYHGPISTDGGVTSHTLRYVEIDLGTSSWTLGSIEGQANSPCFIYKITCLNPPADTSEMDITMRVAQGGLANIYYHTPWWTDGSMFSTTAAVMGAPGLTAAYAYEWGGGYDYPNFDQTIGNMNKLRGSDEFTDVTLTPCNDGTFKGYLYVFVNPIIMLNQSGNSSICGAVADWEEIPIQVTSGP